MLRGLPRSALGPFAGFAAFGVLWGGWAVLVPLVQEELEATKGELGLALLFVGAGALPAMLLAGPALNRFGPRVLPVTLLALAAAALPPAFAGSLAALALALFAMGAASGSLDVAINAAAAEVEVRTGRRVMHLAHALFSAGVLAGALGVGLAREAGAGRVAALCAIAVVLVAAAAANRGHPPASGTEGESARIRFRRPFVLIGLACGAAFLVEGGMENWSALYLERDLEASPALSALGPASYALAMVAGRLSGQWITGRVADRVLLAGGAALSAAGLVLAAGAPSVGVAAVAFFLGGAGVSVAAPVAFSAAGRGAGPSERGTAVATVTTLGYLGFLAGPPLLGGTAELIGLRASFLVLAGVAAALALGATRLRLEQSAPATAPGRTAGP